MAGVPFTSRLSIADFALMQEPGLRPVRQVMGSSVFQVGFLLAPSSGGVGAESRSTELDSLTAAWNAARRLALERLETQAREAGCHVVVGVGFDVRRDEVMRGTIEIVVTGTAARRPDGEPGERPVLTDLSMPDYVLLRRSGYMPVGVVAATSVFSVVLGAEARRLTTGWGARANQELEDFTQGVYSARELAIGRATAEATRLGAGGLVGMSIEQSSQQQRFGHDQSSEPASQLIVTFHVVGTAIAAADGHEALAPRTIVRQGARAT